MLPSAFQMQFIMKKPRRLAIRALVSISINTRRGNVYWYEKYLTIVHRTNWKLAIVHRVAFEIRFSQVKRYTGKCHVINDSAVNIYFTMIYTVQWKASGYGCNI